MKYLSMIKIVSTLLLFIGCTKGDSPYTASFSNFGPTKPPIPGFKYSFDNTDTNKFTVIFTDTSKNATLWKWEFGDDSTSSIKNPIHVYKNIMPGTFKNVTVTLTVANPGSGIISAPISATIQVGTRTKPEISDPILDNTVSPNPSNHLLRDNNFNNPGVDVWFNVSTVKNASSLLWEFDDGQTSSLKNPMHTYTTSGHYVVKLTATSISGDRVTKTLDIGNINVYDGMTFNSLDAIAESGYTNDNPFSLNIVPTSINSINNVPSYMGNKTLWKFTSQNCRGFGTSIGNNDVNVNIQEVYTDLFGVVIRKTVFNTTTSSQAIWDYERTNNINNKNALLMDQSIYEDVAGKSGQHISIRLYIALHKVT